MGRRRVAQQVSLVITEVEQPRRRGAVLRQVARIIGPVRAPRRGNGPMTAAPPTGALRVTQAFLFVGATQAGGGEIQAFGQVPGALGEQLRKLSVRICPLPALLTLLNAPRQVCRSRYRPWAVVTKGFVIQVGASSKRRARNRRNHRWATRGGTPETTAIFHDPGVADAGTVSHHRARGEIPPAISTHRGQGEVAGRRVNWLAIVPPGTP